jgi:EamA domain-containing membrane protein RarD
MKHWTLYVFVGVVHPLPLLMMMLASARLNGEYRTMSILYINQCRNPYLSPYTRMSQE